jgi:hypothetical protein
MKKRTLHHIFFMWMRFVKSIKGLGEYVEEDIVVQKVFMSLPSIFNPKILVIEEMNDLDKLTVDELHGTLTTYEMRIEQDNPPRTFKEGSNI